MNSKQIHTFVMRYLEATDCRIIEKTPTHVTVKLSPEADKALSGRSYYWSFVERTGAEPETMTFTFVFEPDKLPETPPRQAGQPYKPAGAAAPAASPSRIGGSTARTADGIPGPSAAGTGAGGASGQPAAAAGTSILARFFGIAPPGPTGRIPRDEMTFGSRRLEQLFAVVCEKGRFIRLFEEAKTGQRGSLQLAPYCTWLGINYKVELACDMKRDELHTLGLQLSTGEIRENFYGWLTAKKLSPRLPANVYIQPARYTLDRAASLLEQYMEKKLSQYDHRWASDALQHLRDELAQVDAYYGELVKSAEGDKKLLVAEQHHSRQAEVDWQYRPHIRVSVINCGLFHLDNQTQAASDETC